MVLEAGASRGPRRTRRRRPVPRDLVTLYDRILGHPFVYNHIRPRIVGGIDMSPVYDLLGADAGSSVLDVGCGSGDALIYMRAVERYLGVDVDPTAIRRARERYGSRLQARFEHKRLEPDDVAALAPTHVVMAGLLHHLTDDEALAVLRMVRASPRLSRVVTQDVVFLQGEWLNNVFAALDRGRFCRRSEQYERLVAGSNLALVSSAIVRSSPNGGRVKYLVMSLEPRGR